MCETYSLVKDLYFFWQYSIFGLQNLVYCDIINFYIYRYADEKTPKEAEGRKKVTVFDAYLDAPHGKVEVGSVL